MERIVARDNLLEALQRVRRNRGSPGIDGMTVEEMAGYLKGHWVGIREQLLTGTYRPQPVTTATSTYEAKRPVSG